MRTTHSFGTCLRLAARPGGRVCTLTGCGLNCVTFRQGSCARTDGCFRGCVRLRGKRGAATLTSTCGHVNSYRLRMHGFRRTGRCCSRTRRVGAPSKSCSFCRLTLMSNLRGSCANGVALLGHLINGCPTSPCTMGTVCRGKHSCILVSGGGRTVASFGRLLGGCPRDPIDQGTTTRVNLLFCRGKSCGRTVRTCGRIVRGCPNDRRTHLTVHSLGSVCMSLGHVSRFTTLTGTVPKRVHFSTGRRSSLACATTRGVCVGNEVRRTGADLGGCLRAFPRKTFDLGTRCCLYLVNDRRGGCSVVLLRSNGLLRCPGGPFTRRTLVLQTRMRFGRRGATRTLTDCGVLGRGTAGMREHRLTRANVLHYTFLLESSIRAVRTTASLLMRPGLDPRLEGRTLCCHTGTCAGRGTNGGTVSSCHRLTGSAHGPCNTRTGCRITRKLCSTGRCTTTRGRLLGCVRRDAPRTC